LRLGWMRASCNRLSLRVPYVASYVVTRCANPTRGYVMTPRGTQLIDKLSIGLNLMPFVSDPIFHHFSAARLEHSEKLVYVLR